ncbi:uncharacterized protein [Nicotiana sylvestris]|uniref:uncharacterized protein n=1 Tax=Nicotiana sylvestris TaxID=4096 RepID=UPI00388C7BF1
MGVPIQKNRSAANGMNLTYIPPQIVDGKLGVELEKEEVDKETEKWRYALIVYFIGEVPDIYLHEEGYYMIKFQSIEDLIEIYHDGSYSIGSRPIILKVRFPKLPMNCWGINSFSKISNAIANPIFADECTTKQTRISYARMLIEVHVTKRLLITIEVKDPNGKKFQQEVAYDWNPEFCEQCPVIGHKCITQHRVERQ